MQIRIQNAEALSQERIPELLKRESIEFTGRNRADLYRWVRRVLVRREFAAQGKSGGYNSGLPEQIHWAELRASDAVDPSVPPGRSRGRVAVGLPVYALPRLNFLHGRAALVFVPLNAGAQWVWRFLRLPRRKG